jgi:hypothetical protein
MNMMTQRGLNRSDFKKLYKEIYTRADKIVERVLAIMFLFGLLLAPFYETWLVAIGVGGLCLVAYFSTKKILPGSDLYQYVLSAISAVFAAQYIYQMHGMAEMHFWVFISSTVLIIYQNWRLQVPLILIVYLHHALFAYLQYRGYEEVYFTRLAYMDLTTFIFHAVLAAGVCFVSGFWGYNIRKRTIHDALNFKALSVLQEELQQSAQKMDELNKHLMEVNKEVQLKNEELQASSEELLASEEELMQINENLNNLVVLRTEALIKQNDMLIKHAFINAHKVRSPLARILGIANLFKYEADLNETKKELIRHLNLSANELDDVLSEVRVNLQEAEFKDKS